MAWALIGSGSGNVPNGNASADINVVCTTVGADLIWAGIACYQGSASYPTISDNHSGSWSGGIRADGGGGNRHFITWYQFSPASDASFTVTFTHGGENYSSGGAMSFSGSSGVFGAQVPAASGALGTVSGKNADVADGSGVTTSEADMLLIAGEGSDGEYNKIFDPSGGSTWVNTGTNTPILSIISSSGNHVGFAASYRALSGGSGTQYGVRFNEPNFVANEAGISIMSFKPAGGGGGGRGLFMPPSLTLGSGGSFFSDGTR